MDDGAPVQMLDGYKVLDFTQAVAGPTATLMLAEMGAEVIKVELAPNGDPTRTMPLVKNGRSGYFVQHNRGKKGICVDVKNPEGLALIKRLIPQVDVLMENFAPGVIGRLGLDYATVKALNPQIVMCSLSAFGQTGPLANEPGFDTLGAAYAGITSMGGEADGSPYVPQAAIGDVSTGAHAALGICAALLYRGRTGRGQYLDVSLLDTYFHYHEISVQMHSLSGGEIKPFRAGRHSFYLAPVGIFKGRDKYIVIMCALDHQWLTLCEVMGQPELAKDRRFATRDERIRNLPALIEVIEAWLRSMPSDEAAMDAMRARRVPMAPVLTVAEAVKHPHLRERGTVRKVRDRKLGDFELPGFAIRFSDFPCPLELEAPFLGEHNEEVFARYLGFDAGQVRQLEHRGIVRKE
ncbi:MAG: CoA transferase [Candidatus Binataceae bacterium]|nr:CoA transferase [Candidatus Binataceae bacterium]